jgi:hypothetical protein
VWFATAAFTLLLVGPEIGSSDSQIAKRGVESAEVAPYRAGLEVDAASWYAYRAANRREAGVTPDPKRAPAAPIRLQ